MQGQRVTLQQQAQTSAARPGQQVPPGGAGVQPQQLQQTAQQLQAKPGQAGPAGARPAGAGAVPGATPATGVSAAHA